VLGDDVVPDVGRGREENSHAGVFGDGDDLGDGFGEGEWGVGFFKKWGEELEEFEGEGFCLWVFGFESCKAEAVDGVDGGVKDATKADSFFEFVTDAGTVGEEGTAGSGEMVVNGDKHFQDGEGFARTCNGRKLEIAGGLQDEINRSGLLGSEVGGGSWRGLGRGGEGRGKGDHGEKKVKDLN